MSMRDHLLSRFFDVTKYSGVMVEDEFVTLPLWNLSGQMVGVQTYNPSQPKKEVGDPQLQKYFSWVTKPCASKNAELAVWGLETVNWTDRFLFLTEGIFDASRLHWHGLPAVAVLSNNPVHLASWFRDLRQTTVACVQGDKAGQKLANFGQHVVRLPENEDVNSLKEEAFAELFAPWLT